MHILCRFGDGGNVEHEAYTAVARGVIEPRNDETVSPMFDMRRREFITLLAQQGSGSPVIGDHPIFATGGL